MWKPELLAGHIFTFNPDSNGGESLTLYTRYTEEYDEEKEFSTVQTLTLSSYENSASFRVGKLFNPTNLRKLADELEEIERKLK